MDGTENQIKVEVTLSEIINAEHGFKSLSDAFHRIAYSRLTQAGVPVNLNMSVKSGKLVRENYIDKAVFTWSPG